ncbi:FAD-binding oxidoreductase [Pedobacter sp. L105]|uniref:FAD-binding oxidoreductase n=1 Tax=Pedobacter sp. L105 TaxID=1641871 RepID=UPI00131DB1E1|nr:FAD-binding oxidoreductase [Pedobacter sp. L105]
MKNIVRILDIQQVTHNVKCFKFEKPSGFHFTPGQATDVSINKPGMEDEVRPFTFTSLGNEPYLEFTIKGYPDHHGVTEKLHQLQTGDELIIADAWGAIEYKGPGYFIAGGAGITPFISILRELHKENKIAGNTLFFSNKTASDIIYEKELVDILGDQAIFILSEEEKSGYLNGHIDEAFIEQHMPDHAKQFYICGPDPMVADMTKALEKSGIKADAVVIEK